LVATLNFEVLQVKFTKLVLRLNRTTAVVERFPKKKTAPDEAPLLIFMPLDPSNLSK
jgi:hypothetical protein